MVLFSDDKIEFFEEFVEETEHSKGSWKVLIVDDEKIVHESTKMVLSDFVYQDRGLDFLCAYNAEEAKSLLKEHEDIAVVLLDVVMEKDDSGLQLVKYIRDEIENKFIRIILRTGQPGQAPEEEVVINYDINDYKMKTELTLQKLLTTVVSALRSYANIMDLEMNRRGLESILRVENELYELHDMSVFANLLLVKVRELYKISGDSFYLRVEYDDAKVKHMRVIAGTGKYEQYIGSELPSHAYNEMAYMFDEIGSSNGSYSSENEFLLLYKSLNIFENYIYFDDIKHLDAIENKLFKVLLSNLSVAVDNISLNEKLVHTQSELINRLSEVIEARSEETASHVERVSKIAYMLAQKIGLNDTEANLLKTIAPLHDVGKIGIPESILNKPGKLTDDEFAVMKNHALIGYRILKGSGLELLEAGALVAKEHHEYWNGNGYPYGLAGEEIHIYGRITIIADVFDALSHDRVYKKAWPFEKVMDFMKEQSGKMFDPTLIQVLFDHEDEIRQVYHNDAVK